jgi:DNA-binding LacI/PurR family transcriptional regulator
MTARISMRDIAARAEVSVMTVSLALRNSTRVSAATRKRIRDLADELGFHPDPALRALVTYRRSKNARGFAGTIAYLNNTSFPSVVNKVNIHREVFKGVRGRADLLGYQAEEFWLREPGMTSKRITGILRARGIQGLIIGPQERPHGRMDLEWDHFCTVSIGFSLEYPSFHVVAGETFKSMLLCMRELSKLGYQRIGLVILPDQDERTQNRYIGAYHAAWECLPRRKPIPILRTALLNEETFSKWFKKTSPDAIIGPNEKIPKFLEKLGCRIPGDIGFACPFCVDRFSHADGCPQEVGRAAAELVSNMIDRNETGVPTSPRTLMIEPLWVPRPSLKKVGDPILF